MGDQLSFEDILFDRERKLLFLTSHLDNLMSLMHYHRTMMTATIYTTLSTRIGKTLSYAKHDVNTTLEWLSQMVYYTTLELSVIPKEKDWYDSRMDSDTFVPDAATTPYALYESYIKIYKGMVALFDENEGLIDELKTCSVLVREIYANMQKIGELYEDIL